MATKYELARSHRERLLLRTSQIEPGYLVTVKTLEHVLYSEKGSLKYPEITSYCRFDEESVKQPR
jgi:hypothetical protein